MWSLLRISSASDGFKIVAYSSSLDGVDVLKLVEFLGSIGEILLALSMGEAFRSILTGEKNVANPIGVERNSGRFLILFGIEYKSSIRFGISLVAGLIKVKSSLVPCCSLKISVFLFGCLRACNVQ